MELKITPSGQTIVKSTALGPVANTDTKLLIYGLFQKGRVLAQDGIQVSARERGTPLLDGVFPARAEADIASDTPQIWGSPRVDDDRNGPARQS